MNPINTLVLFIVLLAGLARGAVAQDLVLNYSGTFSADSTLGGVEFGSPVDFTYSARFDSTTDIEGEDGAGTFDAVVTFQLAGLGMFVSDPATDVNVILFDPSGDEFGAFLGDRFTEEGFGGLFSTATPAFDADTPSPSIMTDFIGPDGGLPFTIPLSGGAGDLVVNGVTNGLTAEIAAVPEPAALALLTLGGLTLTRRRARRERYAARAVHTGGKPPMHTRMATLALLALISFCGAGRVASATVIDFDALETPTGGPFDFNGPYVEDGFRIAGTQLRYFSQDDGFFYAGSVGLFFEQDEAILTRVDGGPFQLESIDLSILNPTGSSPPVTFTGTLQGGGTVVQSHTPTDFGFSTFSFDTGFTNLTSVSWAQGPNQTNAHQFDNIVVNEIPSPTSLTLLALGGLTLIGAGCRRRTGDTVTTTGLC